MDEIDVRIKKILKNITGKAPDIKKDNCPGDEVLSQFIDGNLDKAEKEGIENHLIQCNYCLGQVLLHKKIRDDERYDQFPAPSALCIKNMKTMFTTPAEEDKAGLFDIALKFTREKIEVIRNPGNLAIAYDTAYSPVRSDKTALFPNFIILSKTFSGLESKLEIERVNDLSIEMNIRIMDIHSKSPANGLRVSLSDPYQEIASYITDNGEVHFGNLAYGKYKLEILSAGKEIGHISLNIKH